jgi:hypothetical protein
MAFLPYVGPTFSCISKALLLYNIKTVIVLPRKVSSFLSSVKDALGLETLGIYSFPCENDKVYTGCTRHSIKTRIVEHHWHFLFYHPDESAMAEHCINFGHHMQFNDTSILAKKSRHMEGIIRVAIEIELHLDNVNREERFSLILS